MEAIRQVRELKTGGFEKRRYVHRQAYINQSIYHDMECLFLRIPTYLSMAREGSRYGREVAEIEQPVSPPRPPLHPLLPLDLRIVALSSVRLYSSQRPGS